MHLGLMSVSGLWHIGERGNTFFKEEPDLVAGRKEVVVTYVLAAFSG